MSNKNSVGNAILWAAAIIASAILHAPAILSCLLLPTLAVCSLVLMHPRSTDGGDPGTRAKSELTSDPGIADSPATTSRLVMAGLQRGQLSNRRALPPVHKASKIKLDIGT